MTWGEDAAQSLAETFDGAFGVPGVVTAAACTDETGTAVAASPGGAPADGRFEIGSVTKTMTAALLALLEADGSLRLDDAVSRWLAAGPNGAVTLRQLATHTSGLPRLAPNFDLRAIDRANPYAAFGPVQAEEGLRQAALAPDRPHVYSNFGYQLLGLVLERASGRSYQELLAGRLLEPLGMTCSGVGGRGGGIRLPGHSWGGEVPHWEHLLAGAGGVEATVSDLSAYARACLYPPRTPLGDAIAAAQAPLVPLGNGSHQALGWQVREGGGRVHGGGTGGFSAAVRIDPGRGRGARQLRRLRPGARPCRAAGSGRRQPPRGPPAATRTRMGRPRPRDHPGAAGRTDRADPRPRVIGIPAPDFLRAAGEGLARPNAEPWPGNQCPGQLPAASRPHSRRHQDHVRQRHARAEDGLRVIRRDRGPQNPAAAARAARATTPGTSTTSPAGSPTSPASNPTTAQSSPPGSSGGGSMYIADIYTLAETINLGDSVSRGTEVDGGVAPYTWSITGLPPGITQQPQATGSTAAAGITGTADVAGTYHLTVSVTDSEQPRQTLTEHYTFVVLPPNSEVWGVIGPGLASGTVGVPFSASFIATNGVTATFSVSSGELPPGISLNSKTGVLAGTPTERGIFTFDIVATNVATGATKQAGGYNFQVNPAT